MLLNLKQMLLDLERNFGTVSAGLTKMATNITNVEQILLDLQSKFGVVPASLIPWAIVTYQKQILLNQLSSFGAVPAILTQLATNFAILEQMLLDLERNFGAAVPANLTQLMKNVTNAFESLQNGLKCYFSSQVAHPSQGWRPGRRHSVYESALP